MTNGDNKQPRIETATASVPQRRTLSLPSWLDGRTIAVLTGLVSIAAMVQTSHSRLSDDIHRLRDEMSAMRTELRQEFRAEIGGLRHELHGQIGGLGQELRGEIASLRNELTAKIEKLDERLRRVEIDVAAIRTHLIGFDVRPHDDQPQHEPS
ncbi:MAG: hypothetical protein OXH09_00760 [Gammaproteobacteria bacterium]|nr:hypothetical protein [Gammaproteobacteria bacterium]